VQNWLAVQNYTMWTTASLYELFETRRKELGLSQADVGRRAAGLNGTSALQNLKRGSMPAFDKVEAIASALGLELSLGKSERAATLPPLIFNGFAEGGSPTLTDSGQESVYLAIPWHIFDRRSAPQPIAIHSEWLAELGVTADQLSVVQIKDSPAHLAVINGQHQGNEDGKWALKMNGQIILATVWWDPGRLIILPDGSTRPMICKPSDSSAPLVLGKVVWVCRGV